MREIIQSLSIYVSIPFICSTSISCVYRFILLIFAEIKFSSCSSSLNEFLGFNHQSILFYYILIWISFAFEIYFLINRLIGCIYVQAKQSTLILYIILSLAFILSSCFTLYAIICYSHGHVITQHDFGDPLDRIIPITENCNRLRLIGIICGFINSILYCLAAVLIYCLQN